MNPVQLVEKRRVFFPHIRKNEIIWYTVHIATVRGDVVRVQVPEHKMRNATMFRFCHKQQNPGCPIEYIGSDELLNQYIDRARMRAFDSFDGGVTWTEVN